MKMAIFPTKGLKIGLLILIPLAALFNVAQITGDFPIVGSLSGYLRNFVYVGLIMCMIVVIMLVIGFYGTIRNKLDILFVMLAILFMHCVIKLIMVLVIIFGPKYPEKRITHMRFLACCLFTVLCLIANILFCIRLQSKLSRSETQ